MLWASHYFRFRWTINSPVVTICLHSQVIKICLHSPAVTICFQCQTCLPSNQINDKSRRSIWNRWWKVACPISNSSRNYNRICSQGCLISFSNQTKESSKSNKWRTWWQVLVNRTIRSIVLPIILLISSQCQITFNSQMKDKSRRSRCKI